MTTYDDFTAQMMGDMDPELLDLVKTRVNSFIKWDLIRFFHDNPATVDAAENIARYSGRSALAIKPELEELVESGIVKRNILKDNTIVYSLVEDRKTRALIDNFVAACEDRLFRIKAVYHIIHEVDR